jgi:hypothetical protein
MDVVRAAAVAIRDCDRRVAPALFTPGAEWHNTSVFPGPPVEQLEESVGTVAETVEPLQEVAKGSGESQTVCPGRADHLPHRDGRITPTVSEVEPSGRG